SRAASSAGCARDGGDSPSPDAAAASGCRSIMAPTSGSLGRMKPKKSGEGAPIAKAPTGIDGLDEITGGGFPRGRPTLVVGGPGCGKTMLAAEFIVQGATRHG